MNDESSIYDVCIAEMSVSKIYITTQHGKFIRSIDKCDKNFEDVVDFCSSSLGTKYEKLIGKNRADFVKRVALKDKERVSDRGKFMLYDIYNQLKTLEFCVNETKATLKVRSEQNNIDSE